ncbi:DUF1269 domain-containing protein [Variovorax sp. OV329]|uniref:DUF1269 domain-containing protein n=1 Tax=Variovorax sp. OV329 TaxID=1882825 RepID=UPI0008EE9419|nr:DUF1269 domain-containing protein [Variovorax sp. OV329]SFM32516.1 hypothetical protein SAMN05444747_104304 [Variovorax sp. OV329]
MRRRIYWLMPDLASARQAMHDLLEAGVESARIHFAAGEGADLADLHEANLWQTSDVVRAARNGLLIGCALGAFVGLLAATLFPLEEDDITWALSTLLALMGGFMGAWSASMIGISIPSQRLQRFAGALAAGQLLLMVDLTRERVRPIEALLASKHPEAHFEGEDALPAF